MKRFPILLISVSLASGVLAGLAAAWHGSENCEL